MANIRFKAAIYAAVMALFVGSSPLYALQITNPLVETQSGITDTISNRAAHKEFNLKTNFVHLATQSVSLGAEFGIAPRWSVDIAGAYNPWSYSENKKWKHYFAQPEVRWWTKQAFDGHFLGFHAIAGEYNISNTRIPFNTFKNTTLFRYQGWGAGAGISYGYRWNFNHRWGMEGVLGVGYIYSSYNRFACPKCGEKLGSGTKHYVGPTKVALNLVYRFGAKNRKNYAAQRAGRSTLRDAIYINNTNAVKDTVYIEKTNIVRDTIYIDREPHSTIKNEKYTLWLQYKTGSPVLLADFNGNYKQLKGLAAFVEKMRADSTIVIQAIRIEGYCSIEGTAQLNNNLSKARANGIADFLRKEYPMLGDIFSVQGYGEDWVGLLDLINKTSDIEAKCEVKKIITNVGVYEGREKQLMDLKGGRPYRWMLSELFPKLRRTEVIIDYTHKSEE